MERGSYGKAISTASLCYKDMAMTGRMADWLKWLAAAWKATNAETQGFFIDSRGSSPTWA